jgi:hypothetical protein
MHLIGDGHGDDVMIQFSAELVENSPSFAGLSISGAAFYPRPGGVACDGKYITVANVNVPYELQSAGSHGSVVGSTTLRNTYKSEVQATAIAGN